MLEGSDTLAALAQIFAAFSGFTGIVAVIGQRSAGIWRPVEVTRFRTMLETSLAGLLFSVLPLGLFHLFRAESVTWSIASAILALATVTLLIRAFHRQRQLKVVSDPDFVHGVRLFLWAACPLVIVVLLLNVFGFSRYFAQAFFGYFVGLFYLLVFAVTMFALLLRFVRINRDQDREHDRESDH